MTRFLPLAAAFATLVLVAVPVSAKTLVFCSEGSPENFNPQLNTTGTSFTASLPIYNRLVEFKRGGTEIEPGLAEKWTVSDDGKTITFSLRHNVKWQSNARFKPTREFNADDVLFSFNRMWKEDHPFHKVSGGSYDYFNDMGFPKLLQSIEKLDDYTVKFVLTKPQAPFIADMAMDFATILSAEYAETLAKAGHPEQLDQQPIGTGPFSFLTYEKDATIRYRAFPDYWGLKQKLDGLVFSITKDPAVRLAKLRAGECNVMAYPAPADLEAIRADTKIKLLQQPGLNIGYLAFNTTKKPFDDRRVRQAISMAIDKKAILDAVYQGTGVAAKNLIPPSMWGYNDSVSDYTYDPAAAKKLLANAGLPDGFETDLWAMPVQRPYNPNARRTAELMQADLAKIGIKAKIVSYEWGEYRKRLQAGEHMMGELGWTGDNGDPDNFFAVLAGCTSARASGSNLAKWCNQEFDRLVSRAVEVTDQAQRIKLYEQAQVIMHEEAPFFLIAHAIVFVPVGKNVNDFRISPFGRFQFDDVGLD